MGISVHHNTPACHESNTIFFWPHLTTYRRDHPRNRNLIPQLKKYREPNQAVTRYWKEKMALVYSIKHYETAKEIHFPIFSSSIPRIPTCPRTDADSMLFGLLKPSEKKCSLEVNSLLKQPFWSPDWPENWSMAVHGYPFKADVIP